MSDEDFSLVSNHGEPLSSELTQIAKIRKDIEKYQESYEQALTDQNELKKARDHLQVMTEQFSQRSSKIRNTMLEEETDRDKGLDLDKERLATMQAEEKRLLGDIEEMQAELNHMDELNRQLKLQTQVTTAVPERRVVFTGVTGAGSCSFDMKPQIQYPMEGGTALVTFEDEEVAQKILSMKYHDVKLGECCIRLEAKPVQLLMPSHIEMETHVCNRRVLVSNLPKNSEEERLLDKLELYFSKRRNGGGEVDSSEMMHDSGNVVITFVEDSVAKGLTSKETYNVELFGKKNKLKVTPFLNGEITKLQTRMSESRRTVQLVGIPDIMEEDNMQDNLEIHFQKSSNGGGEVDAFVYNPLGKTTLAVFEEDCPESS